MHSSWLRNLSLLFCVISMETETITVTRGKDGDTFTSIHNCSEYRATKSGSQCLCDKGSFLGICIDDPRETGCSIGMEPDNKILTVVQRPDTDDFIGLLSVKAVGNAGIFEWKNKKAWKKIERSYLRFTQPSTINWNSQPINIPWNLYEGQFIKIDLRINLSFYDCVILKMEGRRIYTDIQPPGYTIEPPTTTTTTTKPKPKPPKPITTTVVTGNQSITTTKITTTAADEEEDENSSGLTTIIITVVVILICLIIFIIIGVILYKRRNAKIAHRRRKKAKKSPGYRKPSVDMDTFKDTFTGKDKLDANFKSRSIPNNYTLDHESLSRKLTPNYLQPVESFTETDVSNISEEGTVSTGDTFTGDVKRKPPYMPPKPPKPPKYEGKLATSNDDINRKVVMSPDKTTRHIYDLPNVGPQIEERTLSLSTNRENREIIYDTPEIDDTVPIVHHSSEYDTPENKTDNEGYVNEEFDETDDFEEYNPNNKYNDNQSENRNDIDDFTNPSYISDNGGGNDEVVVDSTQTLRKITKQTFNDKLMKDILAKRNLQNEIKNNRTNRTRHMSIDIIDRHDFDNALFHRSRSEVIHPRYEDLEIYPTSDYTDLTKESFT